jgi:iron-sulfur cluster assembly protein
MPIIEITRLAMEHIDKLIRADDNACFFSLTIKKTGCNGYMYIPSIVSEKTLDDVVVSLSCPFQVLIPKKMQDLIEGTRIDYVEKQFGMKQLTFTHPKASGVCGCGESFNFSKEGDDDRI